MTKQTTRGDRVRGVLMAVAMFLLGILALGDASAATTSVERVAAGNAKYGAGEYEAARAAYEEALANREESAEILYNLGNVAHRLGEYETAADHYRDALLLLRGQAGLERRILYNLGNNAYRRGMAQVKEDPEGAITTLEEAAAHYEDVIDRVRGLRGSAARDVAKLDAAHNLEVVRIRIKEIRDRLAQDEPEEPESPPDVVELLKEWLDGERKLVARLAGARAKELDDDARIALSSEILEKKTEFGETATEVLTLLSDLRDRAEQAAATAAGPGPGGSAGGMPGVPGAPGGAGAPPPPRPAEAYASAIEAATVAATMNEQMLAQLEAKALSDEELSDLELASDVVADPITASLLGVDPMVGLERMALVAAEGAARLLAETERIDPLTAEARERLVPRAETTVERAERVALVCDAFATEMQAQRDAQAAAPDGSAAAIPDAMSDDPGDAAAEGDVEATDADGSDTSGNGKRAATPQVADEEAELPSKDERLLEALQFATTESNAATEHATAAKDIVAVDSGARAEAIVEERQAAERLAAAHAAIDDALKNWVALLQDAVAVQQEVAGVTSAVRQIDAARAAAEASGRPVELPSDEEIATAGSVALAMQKDNIERTRRVLEGVGEQLAQSRQMQQALAQQGQPPTGASGGGMPGTPGMPPGAAPGGATGPDFEEIDGLVREALTAEREARDRLAASEVAAADPPATLALEKLREALEKANPDQDQQQNSQDQDDQGQDGESGDSEPPEDPQDDSEEPEEPQDPEDEDESEDDQETPAAPNEPDPSQTEESKSGGELTPEQAAALLLEMLADQERERKELQEKYRIVPRKQATTPVEKDW